MDQSAQNKKRSMMLFALFIVSASVIISALTFGSAIHKFINGL
ncbi:MAG: hypothetical protein ACLP7P_02095 [Rhodomicrobium sp.]